MLLSIERLQTERGKAGLSITEVAERSGLSVWQLSRFENGHQSPTLLQLQAWASALGFQIELVYRPDAMRVIWSGTGRQGRLADGSVSNITESDRGG